MCDGSGVRTPDPTVKKVRDKVFLFELIKWKDLILCLDSETRHFWEHPLDEEKGIFVAAWRSCWKVIDKIKHGWHYYMSDGVEHYCPGYEE